MPPIDEMTEAQILQRVARQLDNLDARMAVQEEHTRSLLVQMNASDPSNPGVAIRLDRIEQMFLFIKWVSGGGLIAIAGTLVLLYRILGALGTAGVTP